MSIRTLIVGMLAAVCGVCATIGVVMLNGPFTSQPSGPTAEVVVALIDIDSGAEIAENMLTTIEWHSSVLPSGTITDKSLLAGKYAISTIPAGDLILNNRVSEVPTTLLPEKGKFAYTIETKTPSSNVGRNLVPGNRVDVLWTTDAPSKTLDGPIAKRLLQNVKVLAVGQVAGDLDSEQKSVTLELTPRMDENLSYAQAFGTLNLSLRNPNDREDVEPKEITNLRTLMVAAKAKQDRPEGPTVMERILMGMSKKMSEVEKRLASAKPKKDRTTLKRIPQGMRAVTIQTPDESSGVAGLLEPGDRVDLVFTLGGEYTIGGMAVSHLTATERIPSATLIENIEVLAVDTKLETIAGDDEKKMSQSVTLIVTTEMTNDITKATHLGVLTLTLRGHTESDEKDPRTVVSLDQFMRQYQSSIDAAQPQPLIQDNGDTIPTEVVNVQANRGGSVQNYKYIVAAPQKAEKPNPSRTQASTGGNR